ncbi:hypothetical protein EUTSA_v10023060mg [Eutrema salsugineum]|uniref:Defensin-like domain-containing protein n=1 Tax=Eutrema salsugineum TaxID=72664 RepID=V4NW20_EUTSA|nr:defensin-like protein 50 [Eutrema salsugineum]ESQ51011.1 hypothetical protein EUTSA_v10023060mg [Eutrema salsugineum]
MSYAKILAIFVLVVILDVSLYTQNAMILEIKVTNGLKCFNKCMASYNTYECNVDCLSSGYAAGGCRSQSPSEPEYCCCY